MSGICVGQLKFIFGINKGLLENFLHTHYILIEGKNLLGKRFS